jgi:hypothetical protein
MNLYPKVRTVGHLEIEALLEGPVSIQEKVDGSNFSFGKTREGELFAMSHHKRFDLSQPEKMFLPALEHVQSIESKIPTGHLFRCEYLSKPKHNVLEYSRIPKNHLVLFEVEQQFITGEWQNIGDQYYEMVRLARDVLDIEIVNQITELKCKSSAGLLNWVRDMKIVFSAWAHSRW